MNIKIKPLSKELIDDYLGFFDNIAFSDHKEWSFCYCCFYHFDDKEIKQIWDDKKLNGTEEEGLRNEAKSFINENILHGYLAYEEDNVIGWCNCGNKKSYKRLNARNELWDVNDDNRKILSIVCFMIAPNMRGKGVATELLEHICLNAKNEGFSMIEAYPMKEKGNNFVHYHGPPGLYEKKGFSVYKELEKDLIMRKYIDC